MKNIGSTRILGMFLALMLVGLLTAACATVAPEGAQIDLPVIGSNSATSANRESIAVSGFGEAAGLPDMATATFAVETKAPTMSEALEASSRSVDSVHEALVARGIAEKDIQSTSFNVWREDLYDPEFGRPTGEVLYHVDSALTVQIRNLDSLSATIQSALDAGATNVWGLWYGIDDTAQLEMDARAMALEDANDRAQQLAQAIGVTLGPPSMASELAGGSVLAFGPGGAFERAQGGGGGGPALSPGELNVRIQVDVVYPIER